MARSDSGVILPRAQFLPEKSVPIPVIASRRSCLRSAVIERIRESISDLVSRGWNSTTASVGL